MASLWLTTVAMVLGMAVLGLAGGIWSLARAIPLAEGFERAATHVAITTASQALAMGTAIVLGLRTAAEPEQRPRALSVTFVSPAALCVFFGAGLALQLPLAEIANLLHEHAFGPMPLSEQRALARMLSPSSLWARLGVLLCLSVIVPVCEELLFRGVVLQGLLTHHGRAGAVVLSAALFGLSHMRPVPILYAFAAGLCLGTVALLTRSVLSTIAMHAGVNALPVLLQVDRLPLPGLNVPSEEVTHLPVAYSVGGLGAATILTAGATWLHYRNRD